MSKFANIIKWIVIAAILAVVGLVAWKYMSFLDDDGNVTMQPARIADISPMLRLCTVEIVEDLPVKASIGSRHIFARETVKGSISFDLEKIKTEERGDTLVVTLPPEIIEIYESTEPASYQVYDTWNDRFLGSTNFTTAEENIIKDKVTKNFRNSIYKKGLVKRARSEAVKNLQPMLQRVMRRPVVVIDPSQSPQTPTPGAV